MRSKLGSVLICLVLIVPSIHAQNNQAKPTNDASKGTSDQRGTQVSPLVVQVVGAQSAQQIAAEAKAKGERDTTFKDFELTLTFLIAIATIVQAGSAIAQYRIYRRTLAVQFRPRIILRDAKLNPDSWVEQEASPSLWTIKLLLTNSGGTTAHVRGGEVTVDLFGEHPPSTHLLTEAAYDGFRLNPGDYGPIEVVIPNEAALSIYMYSATLVVEQGNQQMRSIRCSGTILYADENGFERRTGFERMYGLKAKSFFISKNPEYEYQD